jgi:hypothetical protein
MKKAYLILLILTAFSIDALADIPSPNKKPRPTPQSTVSTSKTEPTPVAGPTGTIVNPDEATMTISVSRWDNEATLVITKPMIEKINAAAKAQRGETGAIGNSISTQTLVGGIFLSLAFVFGGVWLARSKGQISKPAIGILLLSVVGVGTTLVIGNVPPPKRVPLASAVDGDKLGNFIAAGKVKIKIVDWETRDDISLVLPKKQEGGGEE